MAKCVLHALSKHLAWSIMLIYVLFVFKHLYKEIWNKPIFCQQTNKNNIINFIFYGANLQVQNLNVYISLVQFINSCFNSKTVFFFAIEISYFIIIDIYCSRHFGVGLKFNHMVIFINVLFTIFLEFFEKLIYILFPHWRLSTDTFRSHQLTWNYKLTCYV